MIFQEIYNCQKSLEKEVKYIIKRKYIREGKVEISIRKVFDDLGSRKDTNWRGTLVKGMFCNDVFKW